MTLLSCSECAFSASTIVEFDSHLWSAHVPESDSQDMSLCAECDRPITRVNLSSHYPCLLNLEQRGILSRVPELLCQVCGDAFESERGLKSHLSNHEETELIAALGDSVGCRECGDRLMADTINNHLKCFSTLSDKKKDSEFNCPITSCDTSKPTEVSLLLHIWLSHFEPSEHSRRCSNCHSNVEFGNVSSHLSCFNNIEPGPAGKLIPHGKRCLLCGYSSFSAALIHTHYYDRHLSSVDKCPGCGQEFSESRSDEVLDHITCIAHERGMAPLSDLDSRWDCPACGTRLDTEYDFRSHLLSKHAPDLRSEVKCVKCDKVVHSSDDHIQCLVEKGWPPSDHPSEASQSITHQPSESHSASSYFEELKEFVKIEKEKARQEVWTQYNERSLPAIFREQPSIPEMVAVGQQYHPEFDHQLVFQITEEAERDSPRNIVDKYGIFPKNEVIIGGETGKNLPRAAIVTFVDSPSIGFALRHKDGEISDQLREELSSDETVYHCVELINPTPFERERKAVEKIQNRNRYQKLMLGDTTFEERPVPLSDCVVAELNEYQQKAVERALGTDEFLCIHGPPGTGKTRTLRLLIRLAIARGERVLATAHSNQAIDNLLAGASTRMSPDSGSLHYFSYPAGSERTLPPELKRRLEENPNDDDLRSKVTEILDRPEEIAVARVGENSTNDLIRTEYVGASIDEADLVTGTMSALAELDQSESFNMVVIDEASQATQPATFIPFLRGNRVVAAGDHLQLPPYAADERAKEEEMHTSLFEHLLTTFGKEVSVMLQRQYRMNEQIAAFPSRHIYDGKLKTGDQNRDWTCADLKPVVAIDVAGNEQTDDVTQSKSNPMEADLVVDHIKLLEMQDVSLKDIGIITPYTAQIRTIRETVKKILGQVGDLKIDTVDSFQGSEREAIIVSFVRSNEGNHSGFLALPEEGKRRLNVAITRAKKRCVLIGDWNTLGTPAPYEDVDSASHLYSKLYKMLNEKELVKHIRN